MGETWDTREWGHAIGWLRVSNDNKENKATMDKIKEYYITLRNRAIPTVAGYIVSFERAIQGSELAEAQLLKAKESADKIEEFYKEEMIGRIDKAIEDNRDYRQALEARNEALNDFYGTLNMFLEKLVEINNYIDDRTF